MVIDMRRPTGAIRLLAVAVCTLALSCALRAQENDDCMGCHGDPELVLERDGKRVQLYVDPAHLAQSVHPSLSCTDCHVDLGGVEEFPHRSELAPAQCNGCHDDEFESMAAYWGSTHGRLVKEGDPNAPRCADCHGSHAIRSGRDPQALSYNGNVPATCSRCHAEGRPIERSAEVDRAALEARYLDRIHGVGIFRQGLTVAPVCTTCHGAHGILPPTDPGSAIHKDRVNEGCARCHNDKERVHEGIVAAALWQRPGAVPVCVDCHQPHAERRVSYQTNMSDAECLACHTQPTLSGHEERPGLVIDVATFARSVHGRSLVACAQCHSAVAAPDAERTCSVAPVPVDCAACHADEVGRHARGVHGRRRAGGDENAPGCTDCHGSHGILESSEPTGRAANPALHALILESPTHRRNIPDLCARCHRAGGAAAERHPEGDAHKLEHYRESIHGKGLLESGLIASANCIDCHTAHVELPPSDPDSTVNPARIADTCGRCHDGIKEQFDHSVHSPVGNPGFTPAADGAHLPHCDDCHSAHSIARTDQPDFRRGIVEQCGGCHEAITETYFDTYHGKVTALGETVAAQCYDCHGAHGIRPADDPASPLHADNIVATCAKCHPGSHQRFTTVLAHATHTDPERYPALYWSYVAMSLLLLGVFGFFGIHLLAWMPRSLKLRREHAALRAAVPHPAGKKQYMRFRRYDRNLHRMVIVSFLGLALTGMTLKFSETGWAQVLNAMLGGVETAGWIHRLCAVVTFTYMALHLFDVGRRFFRSGLTVRQFFLDPRTTMIPTWNDVSEMAATFRWFLGLGPRPRYGKWTYWEKFDYFAVFWGVVIIGASGLILWFPELATWVLPGWAINVATIIHSEEALLATGFIFTIHFFNTHLRPEKFPMDPVVFTGRMTIEELEADKPRLYEELVQSGQLEQHLADPAAPFVQRAAYIFGYTALGIGVVLVLLLIYGLLTVGL